MSEDLERELRGTREMLGRVLHEIGKPIVIPKEKLTENVLEGHYVDIVDTGDAFVFTLKKDEE